MLNAANEVAVASFLEGNLRFSKIPALIAHALDAVAATELRELEDVMDADAAARECARGWLERHGEQTLQAARLASA